jgi:UDP-N-acetylmuramoyl-tripeptide--D-alanyl-D-alanine ligase
VELGTNHFGEIDYLARICRPNIAVITNIGPSHLEHFKDLRGVLREKSSLLGHLSAPRIGVVNADDPLLREMVYQNSPCRFIVGYGIKEKSDFFAWAIKARGRSINFRLWEYPYRLNALGYFNIYNAMAAIALGRIFGLGHGEIARALAGFSQPQGRLEFSLQGRISFINDTYNSNPFSLAQALQALKDFPGKGRKIFVMGDMLELGDSSEALHRRAAQEIAGACDIFIAAGRLSRFTAEELRRLGMAQDRVFCCADSRQAREFLWRKASVRPRDIVLVKGSRAMRMEEVLKK